jgi:hypothetical protein
MFHTHEQGHLDQIIGQEIACDDDVDTMANAQLLTEGVSGSVAFCIEFSHFATYMSAGRCQVVCQPLRNFWLL